MTDDNFLVCDEKDWEGLSENTRSWMVFKTMRNMNERLTAIEKKTLYHKACAAAGGIIGGAVAAIGIKWMEMGQ